MTDQIDSEIAAIGSVLKALEPLDAPARQSVLDYVTRRLAIQVEGMPATTPQGVTELPQDQPTVTQQPAKQVHLKDLVAEKQPRSANEMAALVAYYVSHKVSQTERKQAITTKDIETYFKIGGFRLPSKPQFTLANAKHAGYLDAAGSGEYKLNPVGYNLVVHSMPKTESTRRNAPRKKPAAKKTTKSKSRSKAK